MAVAFTPIPDHAKDRHVLGDLVALLGTIAFSGSYATGGDLLDFTGILKQSANGDVWYVDVQNVAGYQMSYDLVNSKVMVFQGDNANASAAPGVQLGAGAYPGALTGASPRVLVLGR